MSTESNFEVVPGADATLPRAYIAGGLAAGIKASGRKDLGALASERPAAVAGTFTRNRVKAASVLLNQKRLGESGGRARAVVFNSGNANACTGTKGLRNAAAVAARLAETQPDLGLRASDVLVASTGVIGHQLPMEKISSGLIQLRLSRDGGPDAAEAMMTTDTRPKTVGLRVPLSGDEVCVGGMAKGAAMIHPNMGTMLAFFTTDASAEPAYLQRALQRSVDSSFNCVTVDGDSSTNDTVLLFANGAAWRTGRPPLAPGTPDAQRFEAALEAAAIALAQAIARDGEGATKFIEVLVEGAVDVPTARTIARAIAGSNLVKTAVLGADPNWGRVLCAAGYSGGDFDPDRTDVWIGDIQVVQGGLMARHDEAEASDQMRGREVRIRVALNQGRATGCAWGCDLTAEYVRLNSEYTT